LFTFFFIPILYALPIAIHDTVVLADALINILFVVNVVTQVFTFVLGVTVTDGVAENAGEKATFNVPVNELDDPQRMRKSPIWIVETLVPGEVILPLEVQFVQPLFPVRSDRQLRLKKLDLVVAGFDVVKC